jgi:hypothetical protein
MLEEDKLISTWALELTRVQGHQGE